MDVLFMWYSRNSKTSFIPAGSAYAVFLKNVSEMKDKEMMQNCFRQKEMKELGPRILDVCRWGKIATKDIIEHLAELVYELFNP